MTRRKTATKKKSNHSLVTNKKVQLIVLFILLFISYIFILASDIGVLGHLISEVYYKLFGITSLFVIPIILLHLLFVLWNKYEKRTYVFSTIYVDLWLLFSYLEAYIHNDLSWKEALNDTLVLSKSQQGYGIVTTLSSKLLTTLIGTTGVAVLLALSNIILVFLLFNVTPREALKKISNIFHKLRCWFLKKKDQLSEKRRSVTFDKKEKKRKKDTFTQKQEDIQTVPKEAPSLTPEISNTPIVVKDYKNNKKTSAQLSMVDWNIPYPDEEYYKQPPLELLKDIEKSASGNEKEFIEKAKLIEETLSHFNIESKVVQIDRGPTVTCYELQPAPGIKVSKIMNLADDLALNLATSDIRIEAPIPGKSVVGIEVANDHKESVSFKEIIVTEPFQNSKFKIPIALGKDISGNPIITGIEKMPHLLIAGATGSGKSVCINTIIMSILYKANPNDVKLILIDPKVVELSVYNKIPHLSIPVVTDPKKASSALNWAVFEMERRYKIFSENFVRDISSYKEKALHEELENLPYIVIIIDELSDLMMASANEVEDSICRLAQMARACGIHLIIATQRPTVDVITGTIKANIPSRIAFSVSSQIDSRTILDMSGAESLIGQGDMLFYPSGAMKPKRVQGAFISSKEVENVTKFLKSKNKTSYDKEIIEDIDNMGEKSDQGDVDELYEEAIRVILQENSASISLLQRKLKIGYSRAGRIIDQLAENRIIGGHEGSKPRKILISKDYLKEDKSNEHSE